MIFPYANLQVLQNAPLADAHYCFYAYAVSSVMMFPILSGFFFPIPGTPAILSACLRAKHIP